MYILYVYIRLYMYVAGRRLATMLTVWSVGTRTQDLSHIKTGKHSNDVFFLYRCLTRKIYNPNIYIFPDNYFSKLG